MVCTSTWIMISRPSMVWVIEAYSTGTGWQSGIVSLVFFMASRPAALENSYTSPFGTFFNRTVSMVCWLEALTIALATALRKLLDLCVIPTMVYLFSFH